MENVSNASAAHPCFVCVGKPSGGAAVQMPGQALSWAMQDWELAEEPTENVSQPHYCQGLFDAITMGEYISGHLRRSITLISSGHFIFRSSRINSHASVFSCCAFVFTLCMKLSVRASVYIRPLIGQPLEQPPAISSASTALYLSLQWCQSAASI